MKILFLLALILFFSCLNTAAQEVRYFTPYFQNRSDEKTEQIRKYNVKETEVFIEDYTLDKLEISGTVVGTKSLYELDNLVAYIRSFGSEQHIKDHFKILSGNFVSFYKSGMHCNNIIFYKNKIRYIQIWNEEGKPALVLGTGISKNKSEDPEEDRYEVFKDSSRIASYSVRRLQGDTI
jgi:hypothetical protein